MGHSLLNIHALLQAWYSIFHLHIGVQRHDLLFSYFSGTCRIDNWKTEQIEQFLSEKVLSNASI